MRRFLLALAGVALLTVPASAQTADDIVNNYIKTVGGMAKIDAAKTLRRVGKFTGGGGFEAKVVQENKRPSSVREEFSLQGMTGVNAWDGKSGWKIEPWNGKKDPEALGEEERKSIIEDADFDGPLVNYKAKGNKVEYLGMDPVEGTDAYKLKVTLANGETRIFYMDTDYYVPIKIEGKRIVRGTEREFEMSLGDYKEVNGWYMPFYYEVGRRAARSSRRSPTRRSTPTCPSQTRSSPCRRRRPRSRKRHPTRRRPRRRSRTPSQPLRSRPRARRSRERRARDEST